MWWAVGIGALCVVVLGPVLVKSSLQRRWRVYLVDDEFNEKFVGAVVARRGRLARELRNRFGPTASVVVRGRRVLVRAR